MLVTSSKSFSEMSATANSKPANSGCANGTSQIPLPKTFNRSISNSCLRPRSDDKWLKKFEEAERNRKSLLTEKEQIFRELSEVKRKHEQVKLQNKVYENELSEKTDQLKKLIGLSEKLYKEYNILQNQHAIEKDVMQKAFNEATSWYKQNRALKRQSAFLLANFKDAAECLPDVVDSNNEVENSDQDLDGLKKLVDQLTADVARLQAEANDARLQEFESTEKTVELTQELDKERKRRQELESELEDLRNNNLRMKKVSQMLVDKNNELQSSQEKRLEDIKVLREEANKARKERNILAHQSAILMENIPEGDDALNLIHEIENLKGQMEDERNEFERRIFELEEKLEEKDCNAEVEVLEERIKLLESELEHARKMAEDAEERLKINSFAPPPPPPPPPPPLAPSAVDKSRVRPPLMPKPKKTIEEMALMFGSAQTGVTDDSSKPTRVNDVIREIKEGKFTLKRTNVQTIKPIREEPEVVSEMLNILGTLRRKQKMNPNSFVNRAIKTLDS